MVNRSFENLFGYDESSVCDSEFSILELINQPYKEKFINEIKALIRGEQEISIISLEMKNKSGKNLEVEISLSRMLIQKKSLTRVSSMI